MQIDRRARGAGDDEWERVEQVAFDASQPSYSGSVDATADDTHEVKVEMLEGGTDEKLFSTEPLPAVRMTANALKDGDVLKMKAHIDPDTISQPDFPKTIKVKTL